MKLLINYSFNLSNPPKGRLICDACEILKDGKHTNWICRFLKWKDNNAKRTR